MTSIVAYHPSTNNMALLESDGTYWIGVYDPKLTHQNNEPMYYRITSNYDDKADALERLDSFNGDEF